MSALHAGHFLSVNCQDIWRTKLWVLCWLLTDWYDSIGSSQWFEVPISIHGSLWSSHARTLGGRQLWIQSQDRGISLYVWCPMIKWVGSLVFCLGIRLVNLEWTRLRNFETLGMTRNRWELTCFLSGLERIGLIAISSYIGLIVIGTYCSWQQNVQGPSCLEWFHPVYMSQFRKKCLMSPQHWEYKSCKWFPDICWVISLWSFCHTPSWIITIALLFILVLVPGCNHN